MQPCETQQRSLHVEFGENVANAARTGIKRPPMATMLMVAAKAGATAVRDRTNAAANTNRFCSREGVAAFSLGVAGPSDGQRGNPVSKMQWVIKPCSG